MTPIYASASDPLPRGTVVLWCCASPQCSFAAPPRRFEGEPLTERDLRELMRPQVTVTGGNAGKSRQRREEKPGDRLAIAQRRERRHFDQGARPGQGDRDQVRTERLTFRATKAEEAILEQIAAARGCALSDVVRDACTLLPEFGARAGEVSVVLTFEPQEHALLDRVATQVESTIPELVRFALSLLPNLIALEGAA